MCSCVFLKGARSRRKARSFFQILTAYTIIILDYHGVVIKFQRSSTLQVQVVCVYKLNKTSTTASIAEKAFPWKHIALSLVHEEP